jgi:mannose-6-phosphate isomerase-like protein (cupin superfamily)
MNEQWVHHACVQQWVTEKGNIKCEICGSEFKVHPGHVIMI